MIKKVLSLLLLLTMLPLAAMGDSSAAPHSLEKKDAPVYCASFGGTRSPEEMILKKDFPLYYVDGVADLPFVDLAAFVDLLNLVDAFDARQASGETAAPDPGYKASADPEHRVFTCSWTPRSSDAVFDFAAGTLTFSCPDTFGKDPAFSPFEVQTNSLTFLQRISQPKLNRIGGPRTLSLASYDIPMILQDGLFLLPLHTAADFLLWMPRAPMKILCCNGAAVFIGPNSMFGYNDSPSALGQVYTSVSPTRRSSALAAYGYNELCLLLDCFYGLKETHHIPDFRTFLKVNGYEEALLSPDAKTADHALQELITFTLADLHSSTYFPSWMAGLDAPPQDPESLLSDEPKAPEQTIEKDGLSQTLHGKVENRFQRAFSLALPNGIDCYAEFGNTAFVTLLSLASPITSDRFYSADLSDSASLSPSEPLTAIAYAHARITRENSPIENVVLDLSLCPGGDVNSSACVLSWFLGEGMVSLANSFSGGLGIGVYRADLNRDHQFTDADTLFGKKRLFCLISPVTFSSANLTAATLKSTGLVTILGQTSQGGSGMQTCTVTGWDTVFNLSGFRVVTTVKNGSAYDADPGVVPDVYLSDPATFYNRQKLADIISTLP